MKYLPPFDLVRRSVEISTIRGELRVNVSYDEFVRLLKRMIVGTDVDEEWYLKTYEDIAKAIRDGQTRSAQHGYFEGRLPFPMKVDERWYMNQYPDVADSVRRGEIASAQTHFDEDGYREGRLPFGM